MCLAKSKLLISTLTLLLCITSAAQFWDSATGLLQAPSADMNRDGTFMITNNFMNKHSLDDSYFGYHTFEYGVNIDLWSRLEIGYVCVILDGKRKPGANEWDKIMFNQDRHFTAKVLLLKEGEFGLSWMPALAIGVSDPTTGGGGDDYMKGVEGVFHREYVVATKHFHTQAGVVGVHLGYHRSRRQYTEFSGPCAAIDWVPVWLNNPSFSLKAIAEYDARSFNVGVVASFWKDHIEAMFDLMNLRWINFGVRYKFVLRA